MTVLYLPETREPNSKVAEIPHDVIYDILSKVELIDDRDPERKIS
ncbi:MAG: hypothetical protein ACREBB_08640 [Nitrosotalea sp.]